MKNNQRKGMWVLLAITFLFGIILSNRDIVQTEKKLKQAPEAGKSVILNEMLKTLVKKNERWDGLQKKRIREYAEKALEYAKKFKQEDQEVYALAHLGFFYCKQKDYKRAIEYAKKSLELAEKRDNKKEILYALDKLGDAYCSIPDFQKGLEIYKRARLLYAEIGDKKGEADMLHDICNLLEYSGEHEKAIALRKEALKLYHGIGDNYRIARTMEMLGRSYMKLGKEEEALESFLQGIKFVEQGDKVHQYQAGRLYLGLGAFHMGLKRYQKSTEYYEKALNTFKKINRISFVEETYRQLGDLSIEQGEYDRALVYLDRALQLELKDVDNIYNDASGILLKMGQLLFKKKDYKKAIVSYNQALELFKKSDRLVEQAECYNGIAEIRLITGDLTKAYENLNRSREIAEKWNDISIKKYNYKLLSGYYEKTGNYKKALEYHRWYADLNLKIYDSESAKTITEMQTKYGTEKKEKEIELLKKKEEIRELTLSKQKTLRNLFLAGFVLILVVMVFFIKKYYYFFTFWKKKNVIGHYKVVDKIGSGGMGIVYKAHDVRDKTKTFAIKVLREEYFDDETYKKRFKQEALVTDRLDHPNIIKISERGESGGNLYMAMELLKGRTLEQKIREQGRLKLDEAIHIKTQVSDALVRIHGKNIIHRDLKPANIMLIAKDGDENYVKMLDFGLARAEFQTRLTRTGIMVGTTNYLSPEQITNSGISTASDIFSLGIIFYEMVCGSKPFFGESESDIIRAILDAAPVSPGTFRPDIPERLDELIIRMLAKDKESRPTAEEILKTLQIID